MGSGGGLAMKQPVILAREKRQEPIITPGSVSIMQRSTTNVCTASYGRRNATKLLFRALKCVCVMAIL